MNLKVKELSIIVIILILVIVLISILVNGLYLLEQNINQNNKIITLFEEFKQKYLYATGEKYQ